MYAIGEGLDTLWIACCLFLAGSAVFFISPLLLYLRTRNRWERAVTGLSLLLLSPWMLLLDQAADGEGWRFLYGYYLLAVAHTAAMVVVIGRVRPIDEAVILTGGGGGAGESGGG